jgi:hypothetical protein
MTPRDPVKRRISEQRYREAHREELAARARGVRLAKGGAINAERRKKYNAAKKPCRGCGKIFAPTGGRQEFCTPKCRLNTYLDTHPEYQHTPCVDCGTLVRDKHERCRTCSAHNRRGKKLRWQIALTQPQTTCPYCEGVDMRSVIWHGREYRHCPSCGLETTIEELKRMALEEAA